MPPKTNEDWRNKYPLNTFTGETRAELERLIEEELQKAREEERERVLAKWNELYRNKAYSPGMITLEFSRFVKDITSNKTNGF